MTRYYPAGTGELDPDAPWNQDAIEDAPEPMTGNRYRELSDDPDAILTPDEMAAGWHWCYDYDGMLVGPGMSETEICTCFPDQPEDPEPTGP